MNLSRPFISRPIGTTLLTIGIALAGIIAYFKLPVAPLPQIDFPVIVVQASMAGASPDTMANSIAQPLERRLGVIADVTEMTSTSSVGSTQIALEFGLDRDINGAAREVQAAISAARADLPSTLQSNPSYLKVNPSMMPVMVLALTSDSKTPGQIYETVSNLVSQRLSQISGVGEVEIGGGSLPGVRIDVSPYALSRFGLSLEDVRATIESANANRPKGALESPDGHHFQIYTNQLGSDAKLYGDLVVAWRDGTTAIRLKDIASVTDGVADTRNLGLFNGHPAVIVLITQQPGANLINLVDSLRAELPHLEKMLPSDVHVTVANDRTSSIRSTLNEVRLTLIISLVLVIAVVGVFLRNLSAVVIPAVAASVSLLGTFAVMYFAGFSLNNLSMMAIIVATGFVIDDAIVVLENIARHLENGMGRMEAALLGAQEVGFTVLSISLSLVAVFIPLLFLGGIGGRLFREFAVSLSAAVLISMVISLTTTPMMCAWMLSPRKEDKKQGRIADFFEKSFAHVEKAYSYALNWALSMKPLMLVLFLLVLVLTVYLYAVVPKSFFPQQDSPILMAGVRADRSSSFQTMEKKLTKTVNILRQEKQVSTVIGFTGGKRSGSAFLMVELKPWGERKEKATTVINRLRPKLAQLTGISVFLSPMQDLRMGARSSDATYQYTLISDDSKALQDWVPKLTQALQTSNILTDVDNDLALNGIESMVNIDRDSASRLGISARNVDNALYDSFGQRQIATIYEDINQYPVVFEWAPKDQQGPQALQNLYIPANSSTNSASSTNTTAVAGTGTNAAGATSVANDSSALSVNSTGSGNSGDANSANPSLRDPSTGSALNTSASTMVPLPAIAKFSLHATDLSIQHDNGEAAATISFNLKSGHNLNEAQSEIKAKMAQLMVPANIRGNFAGTAKLGNDSGSQALLLLAALITIYIVLGILYENLIHPITVISTLPAAGVGAVLALMLIHMDFSVIALIGVFLLMGIVKKNAILVIDVALHLQREQGLSAEEAMRQSCILRFRPIIMTTLAAALGVVPLAIGFGEGSEFRQPLGVTIIGGLVVSQMLTLFTTPVIYIYFDRLSHWRPWRRKAKAENRLEKA
ncbi:efflux RND transporter permease subunit [Zymomonas mobilis]|uniref:efflux RND transporter permease subunit n=1 Tax=Zymomonas mobilis TaxID=542 RepID=UPI0039E79F08